jgi:signal transduction histidine kinase/CHASE1-domain containing sensor protein
MNQTFERSHRRHFRHYKAAIAIFLIGSLLSFAAFRFYQHQDLNKSQEEFDHLADLRLYVAKDALLMLKGQINAVKQFFYASQDVSEATFHTFVHEFLTTTPHFLSIGWVTPLSATHGQFNFLFGDLSTPHSPTVTKKFPLTYLEQMGEAPIFDDKSYSKFLETLEENLYSSEMFILDQIDYRQGEPKKGFVFFESLHKQTETNKKLGETIIGVANWNSVIEGTKLHLEPAELTLHIYAMETGEEKLLYSSSISPQKIPVNATEKELQQQKEWTRSTLLQIGNHQWKLSISPTIDLIKSNHSWKFWEIPIMGMLISGLTAYYFFFIANRSVHIESEVEKRTAELVESNIKLEREINERKRIEQEIIQKEGYLEKRNQTFEHLAKFTFTELHNAIHEVVWRTAAAMEIERVSVWFYQQEETELRLSCAGLYSSSTHRFTNHLEFSSLHYPRYFNALTEHSYLIIPSPVDPTINDELASYLAAFHIISKLDIPIVAEGKLIGVLCCEETRKHRDWRLEDRHFGQSIGEVVAIMIEQSARRNAEKALQETNEKLRKAMQAANAANAAKSDFLTTVSHELRTPLNAIIGFNQCILMGMDGPTTPPQTETLKKIEKSSFHLLSLINDILDLAKIEAHKMELEIAPHNIVEIIYSCVDEIQPLASQKKLNIDVKIPHETVIIAIDKMRIRQVLSNLLSNAVKFTEKGGIVITLDDSEEKVRVNIADTGIGLTPEECVKIFLPFIQADSSITRKYGGTGLGLVISKRIVNLHGGTIGVDSQKGVGSTFYINLPRHKDA